MKSLKSIFTLVFYFMLSLSSFADIKFSDIEIKIMYRELCLNDKVSFSCFNNAIQGLEKIEELNNANDNLLVIVDYTKPSTEERLFVIDLRKKKKQLLLYIHQLMERLLNLKKFQMKLLHKKW